jgi:hypothetical protein
VTEYLLPFDFRNVREPEELPSHKAAPPPPFEPGEYLLQIKMVLVRKREGRADLVDFISMVMEGPGRGMKFAGREMHDGIQATMMGAPWFLQLFYACFGRRSTKWRMTHYRGVWDPSKLIGRFYRATVRIQDGYVIVTDRRGAKDG